MGRTRNTLLSRTRAGFARETFREIEWAFHGGSPEPRKLIDIGEFMRMFADSRFPVNTAHGRRDFLSRLCRARADALESGIPAEDVGPEGGEQVALFTCVH